MHMFFFKIWPFLKECNTVTLHRPLLYSNAYGTFISTENDYLHILDEICTNYTNVNRYRGR
jgi:hypothetical protein